MPRPMPTSLLDCSWRRWYRGSIFSPNYPHGYPANTVYQHHISTPYGNIVTLKMQYFDLEKSKDCVKDSLKIYENSISNKTLMSTRCGNDATEYISSSNSIYLLFTSDATIAGKGYRIHYESMYIVYAIYH